MYVEIGDLFNCVPVLPLYSAADADSFGQEWREKTRSLNPSHAIGQSRRHHLSNTRGLPSSSQQPHHTGNFHVNNYMYSYL